MNAKIEVIWKVVITKVRVSYRNRNGNINGDGTAKDSSWKKEE